MGQLIIEFKNKVRDENSKTYLCSSFDIQKGEREGLNTPEELQRKVLLQREYQKKIYSKKITCCGN